ncbi:multidrug effflux MFS transporter [Aromatoleum diolicum]|uniref:Bcr/CflA family efflux transporter n=1 Tax=Aromatoleum diolicum TaxID=75796 RepID=A0ABX1QB68_9RHOO|nr:multidrug effflux MFS transporter [Aromatoleum diolicum]NMG75624.1 Bcr/CflA family efflux MFS transporter [Aromatoleum diolicum]
MPASPPWLAFVLAALAAIGPFSIDTYLPAFQAIGEALSATPLQIQQTLTAYMATFAFMVLWHGALADRFGRRRVLLGAMALFALASLVCALAPTIEWLWFGRALQGTSGGAGMVVGRAVIRDLHDGAHAQRLMSRVMLIFAIAPAIAPLIGGVLLTLAGWRAIFLFLAAFGGLLVYLTWRFLPETLPHAARHPLHPVLLWRAYARVLGSGAFVLLAGAVAFNFNGFFLYVLSAPAFLMTHLGLGEQEFGWLFIPAVAGMVSGSALSGRVAGHWRPARTIAVGFAIMAVAVGCNVLIAAVLPPGLPWSVAPIVLYTFGMSLSMPSLTLLALDLFPARRGLASSCQSFLQVGINSVTAGVLAPLLWHSPLTLAAGMAGFLGVGGLAFLRWRRAQAGLTA